MAYLSRTHLKTTRAHIDACYVAFNLGNLQAQLNIMASSCEEPIKIFLEQMALGADGFHKYHNLDTFAGSDELQLTSMFAVVAHWRKNYPEDFAVVHDASANFFRRQEIWERVTNVNVPKQQHRMGDGTFVEFPLRVVSTTAADSKDCYSIQLCDVLAGLAARVFDPRTAGDEKALLQQVIEAGLGEIDYNGIRPSMVFPDQIPPRGLDGPDVVDQMMGILRGSQRERPAE